MTKGERERFVAGLSTFVEINVNRDSLEISFQHLTFQNGKAACNKHLCLLQSLRLSSCSRQGWQSFEWTTYCFESAGGGRNATVLVACPKAREKSEGVDRRFPTVKEPLWIKAHNRMFCWKIQVLIFIRFIYPCLILLLTLEAFPLFFFPDLLELFDFFNFLENLLFFILVFFVGARVGDLVGESVSPRPLHFAGMKK